MAGLTSPSMPGAALGSIGAGEIALLSPEPDGRKRKRISSVRSRLRVRSRRSPARRNEHGAITASGMRPAIFSLRCTAGSPKASTRSTLKLARALLDELHA